MGRRPRLYPITVPDFPVPCSPSRGLPGPARLLLCPRALRYRNGLHRRPGVPRARWADSPHPLGCCWVGVKWHTARSGCFSFGQNLQCEEDEKAQSGSEEEPELQATPNEAPGSTASTGRGSDRSRALPSPLDTGAGADVERTSGEDSEDDVLKYVREIFFS